jgi:hypothetical protein
MSGALAAVVHACLALVVARPAWADHPAGLRSEGMHPVLYAVLWAAVAFALGMAVVAILTVLSRRRSSPEPPAE